MSRTTLRIVIILAAFSIVGITFTQIYWVRKAFDLRENQFNRDVNSALSSVATKIFEINKTPSPANNPVTQLSTNYFVVLINGPIDGGLLEFLLASEFERRNIKAEFEYGIYNCMEKCMEGGNNILPKKTSNVKASMPAFPQWKDDGYYFGVQFPAIEANLISQMGIWGFSSAVMLVVIFFFVYTLFVILKQRRLSEVQKDFINNMTHEFKTPISTIAISCLSELFPTAPPINPPIIAPGVPPNNPTNPPINAPLAVFCLEGSEKEDIGLKKENADVHELIKEAVKNTSLTLTEKRGAIKLELKAEPSCAFVDKLHFTNVIYNLLDNAIKYTQQAPEIIIRTETVGNSILLEVQDNGIGINDDEQRKIFHRFYRVSTGNLHDVKGFGLGLNYVKLITEAHKGKISVSSLLGNGSTFKLVVPIT